MRAICALAVLAFSLPAAAGEESVRLKDGPGKDLVEANCSACHSLDYVEMNAPFLDRKKWEATVKKMIDRFGAPIADADVAKITDYLTTSYGP